MYNLYDKKDQYRTRHQFKRPTKTLFSLQYYKPLKFVLCAWEPSSVMTKKAYTNICRTHQNLERRLYMVINSIKSLLLEFHKFSIFFVGVYWDLLYCVKSDMYLELFSRDKSHGLATLSTSIGIMTNSRTSCLPVMPWQHNVELQIVVAFKELLFEWRVLLLCSLMTK